uniref:DWNN domain-containing protein n=1 Tax=Cyprinus carpio carpio TaxID=630221 RepID=A0A9J8BPW7_CYPCA
MPCVHYKFRSKLTHDTVLFEGLQITVTELKRQIMKRERLKLCDLQISSAQTNEEYTDDEALVPNNTSVIIRRIPAVGLKSTNKRFVIRQPEASRGSSQTVCRKGFALVLMYNNSLWKGSSSNIWFPRLFLYSNMWSIGDWLLQCITDKHVCYVL